MSRGEVWVNRFFESQFTITWPRISKIGTHDQARSQDLEKGGYFERVRTVQTTLTRIFIVLESVSHGLSENWDEISRKARKFKGIFRPKSAGLQKKKKKGLHRNWDWLFSRNRKFNRFFCPKSAGLQRKIKKKGLHRNWDWFFGRNRKFERFFRPKSGGLQKKKKTGLHRNWDWFFGPYRKSKRLRGGCFPMGGLFSIFHKKSASKPPKTCDFAYFTSQWGGSSPPPLATLLHMTLSLINSYVESKFQLSRFNRLLIINRSILIFQKSQTKTKVLRAHTKYQLQSKWHLHFYVRINSKQFSPT